MRAITDAMVRLLIGAPLHSDGKLTIVSLAAEAGLRRNKLTHKHTDLKDLFYALVKAREPLPEPVHETERARLAKQRVCLARVRAERDDLRSQAQLLARVLQVLEIENHRLMETNAALEQQLADRVASLTSPAGADRTPRLSSQRRAAAPTGAAPPCAPVGRPARGPKNGQLGPRSGLLDRGEHGNMRAGAVVTASTSSTLPISMSPSTTAIPSTSA
ncbi:hypothetical protein [Streptomyces sp. A1547]|uniref:hypothetical protein n=1 Tax=Streptomyces sp. A1547 TaxID=2563105 RepID=UPI0019D0B4E8|nr:hypothetical protein [Streptomyces sp. A1547]